MILSKTFAIAGLVATLLMNGLSAKPLKCAGSNCVIDEEATYTHGYASTEFTGTEKVKEEKCLAFNAAFSGNAKEACKHMLSPADPYAHAGGYGQYMGD